MTFAVGADAYEAFMGRYSRGLSGPFADFAGVAAGQRALDVGCGPGILTEELVVRLGADAVAAVDPSPSFVEAARAKLPDVTVAEASADALPFADESFDATLAQLVVHFMRDPVGGIREMARVTRPGGAVAACVWDHAGGTGPLELFWAAARERDPAAPTEDELPGVREGHLVELFESAGLADVRGDVLTSRLAMETFDAYWEPFSRGVGPAGAYLLTLAEPARGELRSIARRLAGPEPFIIEARAWAAVGNAA
jgi:SAM-dependent methyltransferase